MLCRSFTLPGQRLEIYQPRAAPWVRKENRASPERAKQNPAFVSAALSGLWRVIVQTQGVALGWHVFGLWPIRISCSTKYMAGFKGEADGVEAHLVAVAEADPVVGVQRLEIGRDG